MDNVIVISHFESAKSFTYFNSAAEPKLTFAKFAETITGKPYASTDAARTALVNEGFIIKEAKESLKADL